MKLIYFYTQNCGPCKQMSSIMQQIQASGIPVQMINAEQNPTQYTVNTVPTIIKVNGNQELGRVTGFRTFGQIKDFYN